jgi:hypothetical protein
MPDGGGPFENIVVRAIVTGSDRSNAARPFDVGDTDQGARSARGASSDMG